MQADPQGYVIVYRFTEAHLCAYRKATAEKTPPVLNKPFGLCTPINPVCGGTPTQNTPPSAYLTTKCASPECRLYSGRNFRLPWHGETIALVGNLFNSETARSPQPLGKESPYCTAKRKQGAFQVTVPHSYTSAKYFHIRFCFRRSSCKMSVTATLVSRISIHIDASPISNILWPC